MASAEETVETPDSPTASSNNPRLYIDAIIRLDEDESPIVVAGGIDPKIGVDVRALDVPIESVRWVYSKVLALVDSKEWLPFTRLEGYAMEELYRAYYVDKGKATDEDVRRVWDHMYEFDVANMKLSPVYWPGDSYTVRRHVWFSAPYSLSSNTAISKLEVVNPRLSVVLEYAWQRRKETDHVLRVAFAETKQHILIDGVTDAIMIFRAPLFGAWTLDDKKKSQQLLRGLCDDELDTKKSTVGYCNLATVRYPAIPPDGNPVGKASDITHVLFCIHGVGQKLDVCDVVYDTNGLRSAMKAMSEKHHPDLQSSFVVFPVQWRKQLLLECDQINNPDKVTVADITLDGIRPLRVMINQSALDVLYYHDPRCCQQILDEMCKNMTQMYTTFLSRHRGFEARGGKVSIMGHSLGGMLAFDLLCHQPTEDDIVREHVTMNASAIASVSHNSVKSVASWVSGASQPLPAQYVEIHETDDKETIAAKEQMRLLKSIIDAKQKEPYSTQRVVTYALSYSPLPFTVDTLFLTGSPVGLFLTVRSAQLGTIHVNTPLEHQDSVVRPVVNKLYNIFHPFDPVAYRLEPIVAKEFANRKPELVYYHAGGLRLHHNVNAVMGDIQAKSKKLTQKLTESASKGLTKISRERFKRAQTPTTDISDDTDPTYAEQVMAAVNPEQRIDWMLQDAPLESQYIAAIKAHISYWFDNDTGLFLLERMFGIHDVIGARSTVTPGRSPGGITPSTDAVVLAPESLPGQEEVSTT